MTGIRVDTSDLERLVVELDRTLAGTLPAARAVVQKGALNIKQDWRSRWSGLRHAPAVGTAVTYETSETATSVRAEIGPDKAKRQGALGNLIEFGSLKNSPIPGGAPALAAEAPKFEAAINAVAVKLLPS